MAFQQNWGEMVRCPGTRHSRVATSAEAPCMVLEVGLNVRAALLDFLPSNTLLKQHLIPFHTSSQLYT